MKNNDYLLPGIAAIAVAILYPFYWIVVINLDQLNFSSEFIHLPTGISSFIFLAVGALSFYLYYGFMQLLHDQHNFKGADIALISILVITIIFHLGTFILDLASPWLGQDLSNGLSSWLLILSIIIYGVVDILLAIILLRQRENLSSLINAFAIINLVMGILEVTVIFSFATLVIFPLVAIILAMVFLRKPEMIEIV